MKLARHANTILWLGNIAFIGFNIYFAIFHVFLPGEQTLKLKEFEEIPESEYRPPREDPKEDYTGMLAQLSLPMEPDRAEAVVPSGPELLRGVNLIGILPCSTEGKSGVILEIQSSRAQVLAFQQEPILGPSMGGEDPQPVPELRGWLLEEVYRDRAVFRSGARQSELRMPDAEEAMSMGGGGTTDNSYGMGNPTGQPGFPGAPFDLSQSRSAAVSINDEGAVWNIDPREMEYAAGNWEQLIQEAGVLSTYGSGGIKIEQLNQSSIGALRGLQQNDVIKGVNGQPLNSVDDFRNLMNSGSLQQTGGLRIQVLRGASQYTLEYRMMQ